jgi:hypothetical protein
MGSGAMIYVSNFTEIDSGSQKFMGRGGGPQTHRQHGDFISLLLLFKYKENKLKIFA